MSGESMPEKNPAKVRAGRLGGAAGKGKKSPHSRENGKLGGRPRKQRIAHPSLASRRLVGWTLGDGTGHEGYALDAYFDASGRYLGPDEHGIEPIFE